MNNSIISHIRSSRKIVAAFAAAGAIAAVLAAPQAASAMIIIQPTSCIEYVNNQCSRLQACAIDTDARTWRCDSWHNPNTGTRPGITEPYVTTTGTY